MDRVLRFLRPLLTLNYSYPYAVIGFAVITAVVGGFFAVHLKINTDLSNLLPQNNKHVQALHKLQQTVGGESAMVVAVKSPSFKDNVRFAQDLVHQSLQLYDNHSNTYFFERGNYKRNIDVLKNNALYFATSNELDEITSYLKDQIQESNKKANPFLVDFDTDQKQDTSKKKIKDFEKTYNSLIPPEYAVSPDSTVLLVHLEPTGTKTNLAYLNHMFSSMDSLVTALNPSSYNKKMEVHYANRWWTHLQQFKSINKDVYHSFATGIASIMLLVMLFFFAKKYISYRRGSHEGRHSIWAHILRMPVSALVIGLPLLISLVWTFGITYAVLGELNIMTSVLFVILFGMGIAYGIHFYARYLEFRSAGDSVEQALYDTYDNTGLPILITGCTTAFSLYILMASRLKGFSDFGFIAGNGIILSLFCMLFILPALVVIFERWNWILINPHVQKTGQAQAKYRFPFARTLLAVGVIVSLVIIANYRHLHFQYNFGELQPTFKQAQQFDQIVSQAGRGHKRNPAYILADNRQQVQEIADTLRYRMHHDTTSPTILDVEALPQRFPKTQKQIDAKLQKIADIRALLQKPIIKKQQGKGLDTLRQAAQTRKPISLEQIPPYFKSKFTTKDGKIGNFVIVYPSVTLANARNSIAFEKDVGKVTLPDGETFYATSSSIIGAEVIKILQKESPWLIGATLVMVFLLLLASFRSLKWTLIAIAPLIIGLLLLFGIMMLTGMKLNLYNMIVLPAILGIGSNNGVHVASRYLEEGPGSMWQVLTSTGQHICMATATMILGFTGLIFASHPGLQSMGFAAVIGKGMAWFTAFVFLPALIQWLEDHNWIDYDVDFYGSSAKKHK
jgi:predicted RND superfamily exporter protein